MFTILILLLLALALYADRDAWRRADPPRRKRLVLLCALTYLPLAVMLSLEWITRDNTTPVMHLGMWLFWSGLLLLVPRLAAYGLRRLGRSRTGAVAAAALAGLFVWGATAGRTSLRVSRVEVCSERLPEAFDGLRIVQLSDLHIGSMVHPERELRRVADSVAALRPDVIVFTGDLVNVRASELTPEICAVLQRMRAPLGVYSVTGNHDVGAYIRDSLHHPAEASLREVIARQRRMGWQVLDDTTRYLVRGADSVSISGLSFDPALKKKRHRANLPPARFDRVYRGVPEGLFNITAVHLPQLWEQVLDTPYGDLTLSGHVHAMQFKINLFGCALSPARLRYKRWSGRYDRAGRTLYINDGIGYVAYPMRLGAWPEITLITLRRCE